MIPPLIVRVIAREGAEAIPDAVVYAASGIIVPPNNADADVRGNRPVLIVKVVAWEGAEAVLEAVVHAAPGSDVLKLATSTQTPPVLIVRVIARKGAEAVLEAVVYAAFSIIVLPGLVIIGLCGRGAHERRTDNSTCDGDSKEGAFNVHFSPSVVGG
jgi:hypothetical protein